MSLDYSAMTTKVITKLQSAGTMDFTVAEVDSGIKDVLKEYAHYQPHIVPLTIPIESRYGTCNTTVAGELTDTVKGQFLTTDPTNEKVVYNSTDHTWTTVSACASTSAVTLTRDIFVKGESYNIYNQKCWNEKQLYIGGMPDYVEIDSVEYPIGQKRNFKILNDVLELDVDSVRDSNAGSTISQGADVDVLIKFNRPHVLTPLTDMVGKLAASASLGATTISGSALQAAGTLTIGDEFYIQGLRNLYTVTTAATIATTAAIVFYPPLECDIASTATTFTFTKSSLSAQQEDTFADLCAARLAINKAPKLALAASAISNMTAVIQAATAHVTLAQSMVAAGTTHITLASSSLTKIDGMINAGTTAANSAIALINTMPTVLGAENDWMQQAATDINLGLGYLRESQGYFQIVSSDDAVAKGYVSLAVTDLNEANVYLNQASGNLRQVASMISVSQSGKMIESWGQNKLAETLNRLRSQTKPKKSVRYSTE
jgi:hypothetical protein